MDMQRFLAEAKADLPRSVIGFLMLFFETLPKDSRELLQKIEGWMLLARGSYNDETYLDLLQLLEKAYKFAAYDLAESHVDQVDQSRSHWNREEFEQNCARKKFLEKLRELYSKLPRMREIWQNGRHEEIVLAQSRFWILKEVSSEWAPELTPGSVKAFQFLVKAFNEMPMGRIADEKYRKDILQLVHDKTGEWFKPEQLEEWLKQPDVPIQIQQKLLIARARNGGPKLTLRDIRNSQFLKEFNLEERSEAAKKLGQKLLQQIAELDHKVMKLIELRDGVIGISLVVNLPPCCSKELGRDIFERTRWMCTNGEGINLSLHVEGGTANLWLSQG